MRLLVVEDSTELAKPLVSGLKRAGYAVDHASDGSTAKWMIESNPFDLIVLDIMLPGVDGLSILRSMRDANNPARVLLLTAKDTIGDRVQGLRTGADDYLVKPFSFDELLARIEALLRRGEQVQPEMIQIRNLCINTQNKTVQIDHLPVKLTPREYGVLEYLARNRGKLISRTEIESHVYDSLVEPMSNVVDSTIYSLRRKIDDNSSDSLIQTRRGLGYIIAGE